MHIELIAREIVDSSIKVHRALGPGLFESVYQQCLSLELHNRGLGVESEVILPIVYDGVRIESGYRLDMLVEKTIVIENKSVEKILPIHEAQILTYLRLGGFPMGFLLNWKTILMKNGIRRFVGLAMGPITSSTRVKIKTEGIK